MTMVSKLTKLMIPSALLLASSAFASPPSGSVKFRSIQYNGSGCPLGTVAQNISSDNQAFTLTFSEFIAEAGAGISPRNNRKNCQVTAVLSVPPGWQFSVGTFNYRGFIDIDPGVRATHTSSYYFQGQGQTGTFSSTRQGPYADSYTFTDTIGLSSQNLWSPCNVERALNINTAINVSVNSGSFPNSQGYIANDSIDGSLKTLYSYGLVWRTCR